MGPLLFIIFINDLPDVAIGDVFTSLYADDTKAYRNINTIEDCMSMQKTLTNMDTWTQHNNIRFNASKCKALTITRKKSPLNFIYKLDNVELERVSTEKDVGVNITNSLTWNTHIHAITAKANKLLGLLKRTCPLLNDVSARRSLYLALVKSQLSYATQVWSPDKIALKTQIERVQRRATRWILKQRVGVMSYRVLTLVLDNNPIWPDIQNIIRKHVHLLRSSPQITEIVPAKSVFPAYHRTKNLKEVLAPSKFRTSSANPTVNEGGCFKCDKNRCDLCKNFLLQASKFQSSATLRHYPIQQKLSCSSKNVIYLATCCKCNLQYVGSTSTEFKIRVRNHKSNMLNNRM